MATADRIVPLLRSFLVVGEIALALVLLSSAGLLMRSFYRLQSMDSGFDPHGLLMFHIDLPSAKYKTDESRTAFYTHALERVRAVPGVSAAGATTIFPLSGNKYFTYFTKIGKPPARKAKRPLPPVTPPPRAIFPRCTFHSDRVATSPNTTIAPHHQWP